MSNAAPRNPAGGRSHETAPQVRASLRALAISLLLGAAGWWLFLLTWSALAAD